MRPGKPFIQVVVKAAIAVEFAAVNVKRERHAMPGEIATPVCVVGRREQHMIANTCNDGTRRFKGDGWIFG